MAAVNWMSEARDCPPDPVSGAEITRLTSAPCINNNIYCEQPQSSADGKRVALTRWNTYTGEAASTFMVADLERIKLTVVEEALLPGTRPIPSAYTGYSYYYRRPGELMQICLDTLEKKIVNSNLRLPGGALVSSVSPDQRYGIAQTRLPGPTIGLILVELESGDHEVIFTHPEIVNPHLQFNPVHGKQLMVQHNRGSEMAPDGTVTKFVSEQGTTLFVLDVETGKQTPLPVGPPHTAPATGHEAFCADTGRNAFSVAWNQTDWKLDDRYPTGNLFTAKPGDAKPTVFETPEHFFNHVCISKCGKYFLCDSYVDRYLTRIPLVIGNFRTGKYATLLQHCGASGGGAQFTHPHAYFTTDMKHVIYNADPQGIPHVFKATVPDDFIKALD